ncbi:MAG: hypothetical protein ACFE8U_10160 [Candidatus Hermodarchaeota archaeon]
MSESKETIHDSRITTDSKAANFLSWFKPFSRGIGMYAWLFQRLTGVFLILYVTIHLGVIGTMLLDTFLGFEEAGLLYNSITRAMETPFFGIEFFSIAIIIDAGLLAALVYHGYNGIRVVLFDLGIGIRRQKTVFWILFILGVISWIIALYLIIILPDIVL